MSDSLYERIGGKAAVEAAVDKFYEKVLQDDRIKATSHKVEVETTLKT